MKIDFYSYARALYNRRYQAQEISFHTWYGNVSMLDAFRHFYRTSRLREDLPLREMDENLIEQYKLYCIRKGNKTSTVNRKLVPLIFTLKAAGKEGLVSAKKLSHLEQTYYPARSRRYGLEAGRLTSDEQQETHHLNDRQLMALLRYYKETPKESVQNALDLFFFSFHACGLRISDIITLEWRHVCREQSLLSKVSVKSKSPITIPLSDQALDILNRWHARLPSSRFVFGLLAEDFDLTDDAALARAIDNKNRALRGVLGRIGRQLDFPFPLTMHVARHTFAVKALNAAQVNVHLISRLLGHSSVLVTEKVYARFLLPTLSHEVREKLSFPELEIAHFGDKKGGRKRNNCE